METYGTWLIKATAVSLVVIGLVLILTATATGPSRNLGVICCMVGSVLVSAQNVSLNEYYARMWANAKKTWFVGILIAPCFVVSAIALRQDAIGVADNVVVVNAFAVSAFALLIYIAILGRLRRD